MAAPRNPMARDEEKGLSVEDDDSPSAKRHKSIPWARWEFVAGIGVFLVFSVGLIVVYLTMPAANYAHLKLPHTVSDTFMIPGTIFMSLLAGALFGVVRGLLLVVFNATAGASSCFFLSKLIGKPIVNYLWPEKLRFFQAEIAKRREKLLNYMLFLRLTPTLPNLFINLASPIVDIPFHVFFLATLLGLIPASYITVKVDPPPDRPSSRYIVMKLKSICPDFSAAGLALGDLMSVKDLYDFKTLSVLFLIGFISIVPTILKKKKVYE